VMPAFRPLGLACLAVCWACALNTFAQNIPLVSGLQPSPLVPSANIPPSAATIVPAGPTAPDILVSDPAIYTELPRKKWEFLPNSLLWEPKLADRREARLSAMEKNLNSYFSNQTTDPSIGLTTGLVRFRPEKYPWIEWQLDLFAVAHLRFSRFDYSIAQDYRAGIPVTWRAGNWQGKIGYEHTSTQLGDEFNAYLGRKRITFERDEAVTALGYIWDNQLRTYGQVGYAIYQSIPGITDRWRYDVGVEWFKRESTTLRGQPFAAVNAAFNPEVKYDVSMNYQIGWMWRKNDQRLGQLRVYAEFFDGHSMFGQLFANRERYVGFGVSLDY
jgi:hypothetical protein